MPIGILGALVICTILYIATSARAGRHRALRLAGQRRRRSPRRSTSIGILGWFAVLVKIGAIAGLSSVMLVLLYGQTRIFYTMSRDGLLPRALAVVHPKFKTPWINTIIVGIGACRRAGFMAWTRCPNVTNVGSLAAFAIVCITVIYLRFAEPKLARPFRMPLYPVVPILGAIMCVLLILSLRADPDTRGFFIPYMGVGVLVYFLFGVWNSNLRKGIRAPGHEAAPMELPARRLIRPAGARRECKKSPRRRSARAGFFAVCGPTSCWSAPRPSRSARVSPGSRRFQPEPDRGRSAQCSRSSTPWPKACAAVSSRVSSVMSIPLASLEFRSP